MTDPPVASRDADRSRAALLDAAEGLFAERGYNGVSLQQIASASGLSRGTPSYFFDSKEGLYTAVLERVFAQRDEATREAFAPLLAWTSGAGRAALREALAAAVTDYLAFLSERPAFARLLSWEALEAGQRLDSARRESAAIHDAFVSVQNQLEAAFEVGDAVLVFVSLTFSPMTQRNTFLRSLGIDLDDPAARAHHRELVVNQLLGVLEGR